MQNFFMLNFMEQRVTTRPYMVSYTILSFHYVYAQQHIPFNT